MNFINPRKSNILSVTYQLLKQIKVKVNLGTLSKKLESHPEYPGLLTICDCLKSFSVDNQVYRIEKEDYSHLELPFPFISHSSKDAGSFFLVHGISNGAFRISDDKARNVRIKKEDFFASWEGLVLFAKATVGSGEPGYVQQYILSLLQKLALPAFCVVFLTSVVYLFRLHSFNPVILLLCMLKLCGSITSVLLIAQSFSTSPPWMKNICINGGRNFCHAILQSKAAYITPWFSWAEAGFFYFSGTFLIALIFPAMTPLLFWTNIFALPYTVYALYYQHQMKKWCLLCCTAHALLLLEYVTFIFVPARFDIDVISSSFQLIPFLICLLIPVLIWGVVKPVLEENSMLKSKGWQLKQFKYNSELFSLGLMNQQHYEAGDTLRPIVLGNYDAKVVITLISSPFCSSCTAVHHFFDQWLRERDDLQLRIIVLADGDASQIRVAEHMIALGSMKDKKLIVQALNDWYGQSGKVYQKWAKRYPVLITENIRTTYRKQQKWCEEAGINFTPAILINGHILPEPYEVEDLKYLIR